jgi:TP901 family phage tail tape measure protein
LANVNAVSKATAEEFRAIEQAAADAGTTTRFTAGQAAEALFFLSSAGLDASESIAALDGVLKLAGATGSDLGSTAETVAATLSQFDLASEKSTDVANIFAAANSNSQATMEKLAGALRQVGPVAAGLNVGLEETVGSLQALFNAGFRGEAAGRALKSALADLANEASPTIEKLNGLGIAFEDVDPTVVGLTGAIGALERSGITTAQTIEAFGKVAGPQLVTLIKAGESALIDYESAVTGTNEAARQYAIQNDTLAGSIDAFKSATEGASNALIKTLAPIFRTVLDLVAGLLRVIAKLPTIIQGLGAGAASAAIGVGILTKALALFGIALSAPLGVVAGVGALAVGLVTLANIIKQKDIEEAAEDFAALAEELNLTGLAVDDFIKKARTIEISFRSLQASGGAVQDLNKFIEETNDRLGTTTKEVIAVGLASKDVTDEYKAQLTEIERQIIQQEDLLEIMRSQVTIEEAIELSKINQARVEAKALKERELLAKKEKERVDRLKSIGKEIKTLDELAKKGAISEIDLLEEKKSLREKEISLLIEQALLNEDTSDETIKGIKEQQDQVKRYIERIEELEKQQEKTAKKEDAAKERSIASYNEQIQLVNQYLKEGLIKEEEALNQKVTLTNEYIGKLREQAKEEGILSTEVIANIKEQQKFLSDYKQEIKKIKEELAGVKDPSLIEEIKIELEANIDVALSQSIKLLEIALNSAVKKATEDAKILQDEISELTKKENERLSSIEQIESQINDNKKEQLEKLKDQEITRLDRISEIESELNEEKITQLNDLKKEEVNRLNRIGEIEATLGAKRLEIIKLEEEAAINAIDTRLSAEIEALNEEERAALAEAGFIEQTKLDQLKERLAEEEDVEKQAEIQKLIDFENIRVSFDTKRKEAEIAAQEEIQKARDDANAKRLTAAQDFGAVIDVTAQKQQDFIDLQNELNTLKETSNATEVEALVAQIDTEKTLLEELNELKNTSLQNEITALEDQVENETSLVDQLNALKEEGYDDEISRLQAEKDEKERVALATENLTTAVLGLGEAGLKAASGDYVGALTKALEVFLMPAMESAGAFIADNLSPELIELGERFEEVTAELGEALGPVLLTLLELLAPFIDLLLSVLELLIEFLPLIEIFIKLNPQLQALIFWANILTGVIGAITNGIQELKENSGPLGDFFDTVLDFIDSISGKNIAEGAGGLLESAGDFLGFQTGGIVASTSSGDGALVRVAENGFNETLYNDGPTGQSHTQQMAGYIAQALIELDALGGNVTVNNVIDGKQVATSTVRYINNGTVKLKGVAR